MGRMCKLYRLICLLRGHKWEKHWERIYYDPLGIDDTIPRAAAFTKCKRCGKILKDVP